MKKIIVLLMTSLLSAQAYASPRFLGKMSDVSFGLMPADQSIFCSLLDLDGDKVPETARVSVLLSKSISDSAGFLQNNYISNEINDPSGELCKKVEKIIEISPMNFGATYGKLSSTLVVGPIVLTEHITVTIGMKGEVHGPNGLEVVDTEITLTETVTKELTL